jgi:hypothetical protein
MHLLGMLQEGQTYRLESRASRVDTLGAYEPAFHALVKEKPQVVLANGGRDEALE